MVEKGITFKSEKSPQLTQNLVKTCLKHLTEVLLFKRKLHWLVRKCIYTSEFEENCKNDFKKSIIQELKKQIILVIKKMQQTGKVWSDLISDRIFFLKHFIRILDCSCMYGYVHVENLL